MQMEIKVTGAREVAQALGKDWARLVFGPRVKELAQVTFDFARLAVPKKSYKLHNSLKLKKREVLKYEVTEGAKHGGIFRAGSPPHPIYPKVKQALWWNGLTHPVAYVPRHPGYKGTAYNEKAARLAQARVPQIGKEIENDVVKIVG